MQNLRRQQRGEGVLGAVVGVATEDDAVRSGGRARHDTKVEAQVGGQGAGGREPQLNFIKL